MEQINLPPIALIGGEGAMPALVIDAIHDSGRSVLLLALDKITPLELIPKADFCETLHITQLGKAIRICHKMGSSELVMVGRVHHKNIFSISLWKLDFTALKFWLTLKDKRADSMLKGIADLFGKAGIKLMSSVHYLKKYLAKPGILSDKQPTDSIWKDIRFGAALAKELGRLDIGQTVVVKNRSVVALEAMEGTDLCIERAGQIAGSGCVVVKMAKPAQDMRFDVPVIGLNTIEKLVKIKAACLAIESEKTLILDKAAIDCANRHGLIIVSLNTSELEKEVQL